MKYALITGGTQGIGYGIAEMLLEEGYTIAISARSRADVEACIKKWNQKGAQAVSGIVADLSDQAGCHDLISAVKNSFPNLDVLVNNAGFFAPGDIPDEPDGVLEQMINTNLYSAYRVTRGVLPLLRLSTGASIFNMCSVASLKAYPGGGAYSISKYALLGFSENLRESLRADRVKVVSICPGAVYTRSWAGSGIAEERIMQVSDVVTVVRSTLTMSLQAVPETILLRPVEGDL